MHAWEQQREVQQRWTGDFFNAKLVAGVSGSERPHRVQEECRTRLPPPGSASRVWWSAEFLWDADHQALESMFRTSSTQSYAKFGKPI